MATLPAVLSGAYLATCHGELGMFAEGRAIGEEGLRIAEAVAHPSSLMWAYRGAGLLALRQGDLPRALPLLEQAVGICQDADLPGNFPLMAAPLGAAYTLAGRIAAAVSLLTQALEQATAMELVVTQALCRLFLGEAQMLAGRLEEAHALAERALALAHEHQERGHQAYALRLLGDIGAQRQSPEAAPAETYYQQTLALAEELGMRPLVAHCHHGLGRLYDQTGRGEEARVALSAAIGLYRAMDMTFWLPQTEAALAQVEGQRWTSLRWSTRSSSCSGAVDGCPIGRCRCSSTSMMQHWTRSRWSSLRCIRLRSTRWAPCSCGRETEAHCRNLHLESQRPNSPSHELSRTHLKPNAVS
jgi:tetratricopeptide (TPR) repeat protein